MYSTYIFYSASLDKYYIGSTSLPIADRLRRHLTEHDGFTAKAKDWIVVYIQEFVSKELALAREKQIKKWRSRRMIEAVIAKSNRNT